MTFSTGEGGNRLRRLTEEAFFPCVIPTERSERRDPPRKNAFTLGDFSACGLEMTWSAKIRKREPRER